MVFCHLIIPLVDTLYFQKNLLAEMAKILIVINKIVFDTVLHILL